MSSYFVHNGYLGWSYGTPADPQLVATPDAEKLMQQANISLSQAKQIIPPTQYAEEGDALFNATGGNRFLYFGSAEDCADLHPDKVNSPLAINWQGT